MQAQKLNQLATTATFPLTGKTALSPTAGLNIDDAAYAQKLRQSFGGMKGPFMKMVQFFEISNKLKSR